MPAFKTLLYPEELKARFLIRTCLDVFKNLWEKTATIATMQKNHAPHLPKYGKELTSDRFALACHWLLALPQNNNVRLAFAPHDVLGRRGVRGVRHPIPEGRHASTKVCINRSHHNIMVGPKIIRNEMRGDLENEHMLTIQDLFFRKVNRFDWNM